MGLRTTIFGSVYAPQVPVIQWDGLWKLNEVSAGAVLDSSGNGKDGVNVGATIGAVGKFGSGYSYDGGDKVVLSAINNDFTGSFSIGCWAKANTTKSFMRLIDTMGVNGSGCILYMNHTNSFLRANDGTQMNLGNTSNLGNNLWHLFFMTFDITTGTGCLYSDTQTYRVTQANMIGKVLQPSRDVTAGNYAGAFNNTYSYVGIQDEIMFKKEAITEEEYLSIYNNGIGREQN